MTKAEMIELVRNVCSPLTLDPKLFCAIISTESAWDPSVMRFEPKFHDVWQPSKYAAMHKMTAETEATLQKFSWGLCQIMGANARWMEFDGNLTEILDPKINIDLGARFFKRRCDIYSNPTDKIAAYNYGMPAKLETGAYANQKYVDRVLSFMKLEEA